MASKNRDNYEFKSYIKKMMTDKNRHIQIIAKYIVTRGLTFDTYDKIQVVIKRHLRPAKQLCAFTDEELRFAAETCQQKYSNIDWTLETMLKVLSSSKKTKNEPTLRF